MGKERYFGLTFTLEDAAHKEELRNLSNGYFEFIDGTVRMGVNELEKLEKILKAHKDMFSDKFEDNKIRVDEVADIPTKKLRNLIAGYITKKVKQNVE